MTPGGHDIFGAGYAESYDSVYADKDYEGECTLIERVLARHGMVGPLTLLDVGCGTGRHSIPLAQRKHTVVGIDRSPHMIAAARQRAEQASVPVSFVQADARALNPGDQVGEGFDAALMMFAVLGYQLTTADLRAALQGVRSRLAPGGLFIADLWYGPAVLHLKPENRVKEIRTSGRTFLRWSKGELDQGRQICTVDIHLYPLDQASPATHEAHAMRYFFPMELDFALAATGFRALDLRAWPNIEQAPDLSTWSALLVGQAV